MRDVTTEVKSYAPPMRRLNGELPESRKRSVEQGLMYFQEVAAERDALQVECAHLRTEIAALKVACEAHNARENDMQSRVNTMTIVRDQAVADRAKYEALFIMLNSQMRAFEVPVAPLVRAAKEEPAVNAESEDERWRS